MTNTKFPPAVEGDGVEIRKKREGEEEGKQGDLSPLLGQIRDWEALETSRKIRSMSKAVVLIGTPWIHSFE